MAFRYQVRDLKRQTIRNIAGVCLDSTEFFETLNEVQRRLLNRGRWDDMTWLVRICVYDRCITWPRCVGTVLGAKFCDGRMGEIKNNWYSIIGGSTSLNASTGSSFLPNSAVGTFGDLVLEDAGRSPIYNQVRPGDTGKLIRYYVTWRNDIGKTITIYGKKFGGQPLQHLDADGNWVDGIVLTAAAPFATSSVYVTEIDSVVREATQGMAYLYEYDVSADELRDLAVYEPNETNPRYRKSIIRNFGDAPRCNETTTVGGTDYVRHKTSIEAMVKLEAQELSNDNDFLLIDNFDAYKIGFQAVKLEEANDDKSAEIKWLKAVRELNFDLRDKNPDFTTPVLVNVVNGAPVSSPI